jgi:HK97 family phage major capsid protein
MFADPLLASKVQERDNAEGFINDLKEAISGRPGQGITEEEKELIRSKQERITSLDSDIELLGRDTAMRQETRDSLRLVSGAISATGRPAIEYRSAGEYLADAGLVLTTQDKEASDRIARYRAAEHILTSDTPGIVPDPIVGPLLDFIDSARPMVNTLGPRAIPAGPVFHRPVLNDPAIDTGVALQAAQKSELVSHKFTISRADVTVDTYGGYVNVARQELDWGQNALDIIVNQLAARYARTTERALATDLEATTATALLPASPTAADILAFLYTASNMVYEATGQLADVAFVAPDVWAAWGSMVDAAGRPLFPIGTGTNALGGASPTSRSMIVSGFTVIVTPALTDGTALVTSRQAVEVYEQRIGTLTVTEPSVLGVQIAYAGYFTDFITVTGAVVKSSLV